MDNRYLVNRTLTVPPPGPVYIGRGGKWGNPFVMKSEKDRDKVCDQHREWLWEQIKSGKVSLEELAELHEKTLVCFCVPRRCHGHTLIKAAAWAKRRIDERTSSICGADAGTEPERAVASSYEDFFG